MGVTTGPDGRIYVLGGVASSWTDFSASNQVVGLRSVEVYDPTTHAWSKGKPMPDGRYALAAVTGTDGRIYTIGGAMECFGGSGFDRTIDRIGREAQPTQHLMQVPGPPAQTPSGNCEGMQTVRAFDPRTNTWTTLAPLHVGRILPAAAVGSDGRIYVFGGDSSPASSFEVYDPTQNRWTEPQRLPHKRINGFAAATAGDGRIEIIGGCKVTHLTQSGFSFYCGDPNPVDAYDPRTNTWTKLGLTLNARQALAAATGPDGQVYAVGGTGYGNGKLLEVIRSIPSSASSSSSAPDRASPSRQ
jgi:N-acetylneuraminic acid mutarotase